MYMSRSTGYDTKGGCSLERRELGRRRPALRNWIMQSFFQPWTRRSVVPLRKRQSSFIIVIVIIIMIRWCSGNPCSVSQPGASSGSPKKTSTATKNKSHAFHLGLKRILPDPSRRSIKKSRHQWRLPQNPWGLEPRESSWWILPETRASHGAGEAKTSTKILQQQHSRSSPKDAGRRFSFLIPCEMLVILTIPSSIFVIFSDLRPAPHRLYITCYSIHVYDFTVNARICLERRIIFFFNISYLHERWEVKKL